jgi:hypothetical protein
MCSCDGGNALKRDDKNWLFLVSSWRQKTSIVTDVALLEERKTPECVSHDQKPVQCARSGKTESKM